MEMLSEMPIEKENEIYREGWWKGFRLGALVSGAITSALWLGPVVLWMLNRR